MKQALANLIHVKSEEKQAIPKRQAIPIVPIDTNKNQYEKNICFVYAGPFTFFSRK
jgi:hypothetical protein